MWSGPCPQNNPSKSSSGSSREKHFTCWIRVNRLIYFEQDCDYSGTKKTTQVHYLISNRTTWVSLSEGNCIRSSSSRGFWRGLHEMHLAIKAIKLFRWNISEEVKSIFNASTLLFRWLLGSIFLSILNWSCIFKYSPWAIEFFIQTMNFRFDVVWTFV